MVNLPMGSRPRVVACGLAEHGLRGVETWELPKLWCLHLYFYKVEMKVAGRTFAIVPGAVTLIPPGERIVYQYSGHRYRHFYILFSAGHKSTMAKVPLMQHLPQARDEMLDRLQNIQRILTHNRAHAEILLWGLLWDLAESGLQDAQEGEHAHPLIRQVEQFVESRLPGKVTAGDVASYTGVSMTHVNRVVKACCGLTTIRFIKRQRLQRPYRLLIHSTMPIKLIAAESGIDDLQQFNKLMRAEYGYSPRELRAAHNLKNTRQTWMTERE